MNTPPIAGDVDYAAHGPGYGRQRRTDPRLEAWVHLALGKGLGGACLRGIVSRPPR